MPRVKRNLESALEQIESAVSDAQMSLNHLYDEEEAEDLVLDAINGALKLPVPLSSIDQVVQCIRKSMTPSEEQVVQRINDALTDRYKDFECKRVSKFEDFEEIVSVLQMARHLVTSFDIYSVESNILRMKVAYENPKLSV